MYGSSCLCLRGCRGRRAAHVPEWTITRRSTAADAWARRGEPAVHSGEPAEVTQPRRAPGLQITSWSYQSSGAAKASDRAVLKDLKRRFGRRPIGAEVPVPKTARQCAAIRDSLTAAVRAKGDATLHLMQRPWALFVTG